MDLTQDEIKQISDEVASILAATMPVVKTVCDASGQVDKRLVEKRDGEGNILYHTLEGVPVRDKDGNPVPLLAEEAIPESESILQTLSFWDVYGFYVQERTNSVAAFAGERSVNVEQPGYTARPVTMTLPFGGEMTGLYGFPRVGEKVLVMQSGGVWYLAGHVPSSADLQNTLLPYDRETIRAILEKKEDERTKLEAAQVYVWKSERSKLQGGAGGVALRRKKSGQNIGNTVYSEVALYDAPTDWRVTPVAGHMGITLGEGYRLVFREESGKFTGYRVKDGVKTKLTAEEQAKADAWYERYCDSDGYPFIDRVSVQSAGDLRSAAENHNQMTGKRVEIVSDCGPSWHRPGSPLPLGDRKGDDHRLNKGDIHMRAKKRIVIKAGQEIRLQVGRTEMVIDDTGFSVVSRRVNSNWATGWDASLNVNPLHGISMNGQNVNITGTRQVSMGDSFGGGLSSRIGVVSAAGREVSLHTHSHAEYLFNMAVADGETLFNNAFLGLARKGVHPNAHDSQAIMKLVMESLKKIGNLAKSFNAHLSDYRSIKAEQAEIEKQLREAEKKRLEDEEFERKLAIAVQMDADMEVLYKAIGELAANALPDGGGAILYEKWNETNRMIKVAMKRFETGKMSFDVYARNIWGCHDYMLMYIHHLSHANPSAWRDDKGRAHAPGLIDTSYPPMDDEFYYN